VCTQRIEVRHRSSLGMRTELEKKSKTGANPTAPGALDSAMAEMSRVHAEEAGALSDFRPAAALAASSGSRLGGIKRRVSFADDPRSLQTPQKSQKTADTTEAKPRRPAFSFLEAAKAAVPAQSGPAPSQLLEGAAASANVEASPVPLTTPDPPVGSPGTSVGRMTV
jgi:hypothetical protein